MPPLVEHPLMLVLTVFIPTFAVMAATIYWAKRRGILGWFLTSFGVGMGVVFAIIYFTISAPY